MVDQRPAVRLGHGAGLLRSEGLHPELSGGIEAQNVLVQLPHRPAPR